MVNIIMKMDLYIQEDLKIINMMELVNYMIIIMKYLFVDIGEIINI